MNTCYLIGAAPCGALPIIREEGDLIIACDAGFETCARFGVTPDLAVGDFDSLGRTPEGVQKICLPVDKDDTDLFYAVKFAMSNDYTRFVIYGALGGARYDHTLANVHMLSYLSAHRCEGYLVDGDAVVTAVTDAELRFSPACRGDLGLLAFSEVCQGVEILGLRYEMTDGFLSQTDILTVSNRFIGKAARVAVREGTLTVFYTGRPSDVTVCRP